LKGFDWKRFISALNIQRLAKSFNFKPIMNALATNKALIQIKGFTRRLVGSKDKSKPVQQTGANPSVPKRPPGRPPKVFTTEPVALRDLTPREILQRNIIGFVAVTMAMFLSNLFVFSHIQHASSQEQLLSECTSKLFLT